MVPWMPRAPITALLPLLALLVTGAAPSEPPAGLVWEDPPVLSPGTRQKLEFALGQHQQLTGERIFVAIVGLGAGTGPDGGTAELFDHWHLDTTYRANNALLTLHSRGRGPKDFRPEVQLQLGSGMNLPDGVGANEIEGMAFGDVIRKERGADARVLRVTALLLEELQSPAMESLPPETWQAGQDGLGSEPNRSRASNLLGWVGATLLLAAAASLLGWVYRRIQDQEVLIGPRRWLLIGPRLKVRMWLHRKLNKATPPSGKLLWSGSRSDG